MNIYTKWLVFWIVGFSWSMLPAEENREVYETEVDADVKTVWTAFTTSEGLTKWMAPRADIELAIGGKMRSTYKSSDQLGDDSTIENTILSFDPKRMLCLKATKYPKGFPFEEAAKSTWSIFYFSELPDSRTKITVVGLGYTDEEDSKKMRSFFQVANKQVLDKLATVLKSESEKAKDETGSAQPAGK